MTYDLNEFRLSISSNVSEMSADELFLNHCKAFVNKSRQYNYAYQREWMGFPILQLPEDIIADQEVFQINQPDVIIETGVAWGGSVAFHASLMKARGYGHVIAIDKNLDEAVLSRFKKSSLSNYVSFVQADSGDQQCIDRLTDFELLDKNVAIFLDSCHSHDHVLKELINLSRFCSVGQTITVCATALDWLPDDYVRPWNSMNNPSTAILEFLKDNPNYDVDTKLNEKCMISFNRGGILRRIK